MVMTREQALEAIKARVAEALDVPEVRVRVAWDQKHDKPKVTILPTMADLQITDAQRRRVLQTLLRDPGFTEQLAALKETISTEELRARLKASRGESN